MSMAITPRPRRVRTKIAPFMKEGEAGNLNRHWRAVFLSTLAETSNVTRAAEKAGVTAARAYYIRRCEPEFERAWFAALCEGYDHLEMEVLRRLRDCDFATGTGGRYDFGAALRILAAHRSSIGHHRAEMRNEDEEAILASIDSTLDRILKREEAAKELFGQRAKSKSDRPKSGGPKSGRPAPEGAANA